MISTHCILSDYIRQSKTNKQLPAIILYKDGVRDRPFNLQGGYGFFFVQNFFSDNTRVRIFIFFCRAKREIFVQNLTLDYMTKTLNQIIFFFLHQNQNILFSNIGNQNMFLGKNHNPPFKLNGRSLRCYVSSLKT